MHRDPERARFADWWGSVAEKVIQLALRYTGSLDSARDLSQDVAIVAFTKFPDIKDREHFVRWVMQRTRWLAIDSWRKENSRLSKLSKAYRFSDPWPGETERPRRPVEDAVEKRLDGLVSVAEIESSLQELPERQRKVLSGYLKGKTTKQIAKEFGTSDATIRSHKRLALARLISNLEDRNDSNDLRSASQ